MAWRLEVADEARKKLRKLNATDADRITHGMIDVAALDNPRLRGIAMSGKYAGHWRYRFGDYRVIAKIEDGRMVVLIVTVGRRSKVYR